MSTSSLGALPVVRTHGAAFLASELGLVLRRRRNLVTLAVLALVPVVVGIALEISAPEAGEGPPGFLARVTENGLFLGFGALVLVTPFFMPLAIAVVAGDTVAGEAAQGTLRYLLTVPVGRGRVLAVKYVAAVTYGLAASLVVVVTGMVVGAVLFRVGDVTLLSGGTIGFAETLLRAAGVAGYVAVMMAGLIAVGVFVSTVTEVPMAAMAATAAVPVVSHILGSIPQISAIHPWLLTDTWMAFGDLLRDPVALDTITRGILTQAGYIAVFLSLAWARFTSHDITS